MHDYEFWLLLFFCANIVLWSSFWYLFYFVFAMMDYFIPYFFSAEGIILLTCIGLLLITTLLMIWLYNRDLLLDILSGYLFIQFTGKILYFFHVTCLIFACILFIFECTGSGMLCMLTNHLNQLGLFNYRKTTMLWADVEENILNWLSNISASPTLIIVLETYLILGLDYIRCFILGHNPD